MKRLKFFTPYNSRAINVGVRLFVATLFVAFAYLLHLKGMEQEGILSIIAAAIAVFMPTPGVYNRTTLAVGAADLEQYENQIIEKVKAAIKELNDKSMKELISEKKFNEEVEKLNKEVKKLGEDAKAKLDAQLKEAADNITKLQTELKENKDALIAQGVELKKIKESGAANEEKEALKNFRSTLKMAFESIKDTPGLFTEADDDYGKRTSLKKFWDIHGSKASTPRMTIKAPIEMFESTALDAEVPQLRLTALDPNRVGIPLNAFSHVLQTMQVKGIARPYMALLVAHTYEDGAGTKAEGVASGQSSLKFKTIKFPAFVISTHFNLSDEILDDMDEVLDEISKIAPDKINDVIDGKVLGTAGDDVADIKGIRTTGATGKSTAYVTQFGAASIDGAYIVDVIADAKMQAMLAGYIPNVVHLNPIEVAKLSAKKNTFDDSQKDNRVVYGITGEATFIDGMRVIKSKSVPTNQVLVYDYSLPWIGRRRDFTMEIGYNASDFVEDQKTVKISTRIAFGVRDKAGVIWVSDVDAAAAALLAP